MINHKLMEPFLRKKIISSLEYSSRGIYTQSNVQEFHFWLPIHTYISHMYETIKSYQVFDSYFKLFYPLYNIYLYNKILYNKELYNGLLYIISMKRPTIEEEFFESIDFETSVIEITDEEIPEVDWSDVV